MAAGGARSGGGSFVTKRTRTWREGSSSIAATADGRRARRWWRRREGSEEGFGLLGVRTLGAWVYLVRVSVVVGPNVQRQGVWDGRMGNWGLGMLFCSKPL
jgi:hypothetical protein